MAFKFCLPPALKFAALADSPCQAELCCPTSTWTGAGLASPVVTLSPSGGWEEAGGNISYFQGTRAPSACRAVHGNEWIRRPLSCLLLAH